MTEHFTDGVPTEVLDTQLAEKDYQRYEDGFSEYFKMWPELISKDLNDSYWKVRKAATQMILYSPEDQRGSLVSKGLEDSNWDIRRTAAQMIQYVPEDQRGSLVSKGLEDSDWDIRRTAAEQMIQYVPEDQQINLTTKLSNIVSKGLEDSYWKVRKAATQMILYAPEDQRGSLVSKGLEDSDWDIRRTAAQMIQYVPEDQQINLTTKLSNIISKGLEDNDWDGRVVVAQMIQYVPKSLRNPIYQNIILKEKDKLKEIAGSTPLYSDAKPGLLKQNFGKTGSETTLLLGFNLKDKAIIRTIKTVSLFTWKKAFEDNAHWKKKGFDYIPVEPIIGIKPRPSIEDIDVMTRVITGPTVAKWEDATILWQVEIEAQKQKIKNGLKELDIEHNHLHDDNFVLYFERDRDGEPDISKPPKVYVIDFDQSSFKN